jgi:hypothetical protein
MMSDDFNTQRHHDCQGEAIPIHPFRDYGPLGRNALSIREHVVQSRLHGTDITSEWLDRVAEALASLAERIDAMESTPVPLRGQVVRLRPALALVEGGRE